jgi:hypothetical protein
MRSYQILKINLKILMLKLYFYTAKVVTLLKIECNSDYPKLSQHSGKLFLLLSQEVESTFGLEILMLSCGIYSCLTQTKVRKYEKRGEKKKEIDVINQL